MAEQLLLGLGTGAVIASLALGLVVAYRASGVVNFAHAAFGMYVAYAYFALRRTGDLVLPILGLPDHVSLFPVHTDPATGLTTGVPTVATALTICLALGAVGGLIIYVLVFLALLVKLEHGLDRRLALDIQIARRIPWWHRVAGPSV